MTSSTANRKNLSSRFGRHAGFTLVEMLVVIGIIVALMALLLPSLGRVWTGNVRTRMTADMQAIGTALEAYKQDHGDYPRVYAATEGAHQLCRALIAPAGNDTSGTRARYADGYGTPENASDTVGRNPAPGFRTRQGGKVYPPYLPPEKFRLVDHDNPTNPNPDPYTAVIGDRYGQPILYFAGNKAAQIGREPNSTERGGYVALGDYTAQTGANLGGIKPMFNASDCNLKLFHQPTKTSDAEGLRRLQALMGDKDMNGKIDAGETPAHTGPYLLWSAGPDELFGLPKAAPPSPDNRSDDIANFPRAEY